MPLPERRLPYAGEIERSLAQLSQQLRPGAGQELFKILKSLIDYELPAPFGVIPHFLNQTGLAEIQKISVPTNGKCAPEVVVVNPVARNLTTLMGNISLSNPDIRCSNPKVVISLRNEEGNDMQIEDHRDLLDGHAVIYNYGVSGNLQYVIDGEELPLQNNSLVILNGAADWVDLSDTLKNPTGSWRTFGGVTPAHSVVGKGLTTRNRLLVYADGRPTLKTQITTDLRSRRL